MFYLANACGDVLTDNHKKKKQKWWLAVNVPLWLIADSRITVICSCVLDCSCGVNRRVTAVQVRHAAVRKLFATAAPCDCAFVAKCLPSSCWTNTPLASTRVRSEVKYAPRTHKRAHTVNSKRHGRDGVSRVGDARHAISQGWSAPRGGIVLQCNSIYFTLITQRASLNAQKGLTCHRRCYWNFNKNTLKNGFVAKCTFLRASPHTMNYWYSDRFSRHFRVRYKRVRLYTALYILIFI